MLLLKEGHAVMLLGVCSASIHLLHEHSPPHCLLSSVVLVRRQCFGRCCFCTVFNWRYRLPQKIFKSVFHEFVNMNKVSYECLNVLHWSISMSAVTDLPETTCSSARGIKVIFVPLTENSANLKISIIYCEVLSLKMSITSLKSQGWALHLVFFQQCLLLTWSWGIWFSEWLN